MDEETLRREKIPKSPNAQAQGTSTKVCFDKTRNDKIRCLRAQAMLIGPFILLNWIFVESAVMPATFVFESTSQKCPTSAISMTIERRACSYRCGGSTTVHVARIFSLVHQWMRGQGAQNEQRPRCEMHIFYSTPPYAPADSCIRAAKSRWHAPIISDLTLVNPPPCLETSPATLRSSVPMEVVRRAVIPPKTVSSAKPKCNRSFDEAFWN
ncbi:hypothetical protein IWZ03DRAFT_403731 [Phyllosticta citriasiana]|uniref:Uncharacterized protein n=1 Tax=Phyllosticta citriasiana TaxID=595635 RepID=A0ABR1L2N9_9PEZI